ncbi:DNA-binding protein [Streptomyces diastatochromogenes]|uniref:DNA-binding protein n=1 Tax=Streptomyces diastatochromogenes TaxID=42236 RepID=UPI00368C1AB1
MAAKKVEPPTLAEVKKWPATVNVPRAALALGCSRSQLYELIKRGQAPVRTLSFGTRHVVITASLVAVLEAA